MLKGRAIYMKCSDVPNRRGFLTSAGAGILILKPQTAFGSQANSALEVGLIGCGARGNMIGANFQEHTGSRLVALADLFPDRLELTRDSLKVPGARLYKGYEGYRDLVSSKLDAVVIETPPYARPEQAAAAVAAGRHAYMAKPVAVDVWGCQLFAEAGEKAKDQVSFFTDFQYRALDAYRECAARTWRGDIGVPVLGDVYCHMPKLSPRNLPGDSEAVSRMRNWFFDKALSGDIIVEQNVHALDAGCWMLDAAPLRAWGTGGRKVRLNGDCWDHFVVAYWFPNDVKVSFSSTQYNPGYSAICSRIYGSEGVAEMHYYASAAIAGKNPWKGPENLQAARQGTIDNIKAFVESVRTGRLLNNAADTVRSNLTAILGRAAAYRGAEVTWQEMIRSGEKLDLRLSAA